MFILKITIVFQINQIDYSYNHIVFTYNIVFYINPVDCGDILRGEWGEEEGFVEGKIFLKGGSFK